MAKKTAKHTEGGENNHGKVRVPLRESTGLMSQVLKDSSNIVRVGDGGQTYSYVVPRYKGSPVKSSQRGNSKSPEAKAAKPQSLHRPT